MYKKYNIFGLRNGRYILERREQLHPFSNSDTHLENLIKDFRKKVNFETFWWDIKKNKEIVYEYLGDYYYGLNFSDFCKIIHKIFCNKCKIFRRKIDTGKKKYVVCSKCGKFEEIKIKYLSNHKDRKEEKKIGQKLKSKSFKNIKTENQVSSNSVKIRIGQSEFRKSILKRFDNTCCICGLNIIEFVQGCHIKPWKDCSDEEKGDLKNGICLCVLHHKAFDNGFLTFMDSGKVLISSELKSRLKNCPTECNLFFDCNEKYAIWNRENTPSKEYLFYHRKNIFKKGKQK